MDTEPIIAALRSALATDATAEQRAAGAAACRAILAALEPAARQSPASPNPPNVQTLANAVAALRGVPADQLLELAITRLRAALPAGTEVPAAAPLKLNLVPIPHRR